MTDQAVVETIDVNSVRGGKGQNVKAKAQKDAVLNMIPSEAFALTHEGYTASQCSTADGTTCSMRSALAQFVRRERPNFRFAFRHLPDGRLGVACFAKEPS